MASDTWFGRIRALDVRLLAAVAATLLLILGVMWVIPTTPASNNFTFETAQRGVANAHPIELDHPAEGKLVDGTDSDFYRISPGASTVRLDVHMMNGSTTMIPAIRVFDATKNLITEKTVEYVRSPGTNADCSFLAQSNMTYYVQVFSQRNTTGPYTLTVTVRPL